MLLHIRNTLKLPKDYTCSLKQNITVLHQHLVMFHIQIELTKPHMDLHVSEGERERDGSLASFEELVLLFK